MAQGLAGRAEAIVHDFLDDLLPEGLEWEELVRAYPVPVLALAGPGGYLVGRSHGPALIKAGSSFAAADEAENVGALLRQGLHLRAKSLPDLLPPNRLYPAPIPCLTFRT